jgi:hypothetical protein
MIDFLYSHSSNCENRKRGAASEEFKGRDGMILIYLRCVRFYSFIPLPDEQSQIRQGKGRKVDLFMFHNDK